MASPQYSPTVKTDTPEPYTMDSPDYEPSSGDSREPYTMDSSDYEPSSGDSKVKTESSEAKQKRHEEDAGENEKVVDKWPGWPGYNAFRLIVPVAKVGRIIGWKGESVKKICHDTHARIHVLEAPLATSDQVVLITGKEEPDTQLSPAMDAAIRVFKRVAGLSTREGDNSSSAGAGTVHCSLRLLVAYSQAITLTGRQGSTIKSIQESSNASVRVLSEDELPPYATSEERIVEIRGGATKVLKALEAVLGHLRKFLVDHSIIPLFKKTRNTPTSLDHAADVWADKSHSTLHFTSARRPEIGSEYYGQDQLSRLPSARFGRNAAPVVTQMTRTMQVPRSHAEEIIGIAGSNIAYIRRTSRATLTVQESRGLPEEIIIEIKGTTSQVQMAQQLIEEIVSNHMEPPRNKYGNVDAEPSSYSHRSESTDP